MKVCPLGELITFQRGYDLPKTTMIPGEYPVVGSNGIIGYHNEFTTEPPSISVGRSGNVGNPFIYYGRTWSHNTSLYVKEFKKCDPVFIYYLLKTLDLGNYAGGSAVPTLNRNHIHSLNVVVPASIEDQKRVACILQILDKKTELNQKINDNLQQQLFLIYENIVLTSSGNEVKLSELCDFQEGYVNPSQTHPEFFDGEVKWLRAVDINESFITDTSRTLSKAGFESAKKSALLFKPNTIAISKSGTIGRLGIIADYMCGNRAVINIAPRDTNMLAFVFCFLKSKQREFPDMAVGSVQKNLYVSLLEPLSVYMPENELLTTFNNMGVSILDMIHNNCVENATLAYLRDSLLPKLMSGEIDVSDISI